MNVMNCVERRLACRMPLSLSEVSLRVNDFGHCYDVRLSVGNELRDFVVRERVAAARDLSHGPQAPSSDRQSMTEAAEENGLNPDL